MHRSDLLQPLAFAILFVLAGPATAQTRPSATLPEGARPIWEFDGQRVTRRLARALARNAGLTYISHSVCTGYRDCGKRFRREGGLAATSLDRKANQTVMNLVVDAPGAAVMVYDVADAPCDGTALGTGIARPTASSAPGRCLSGYRVLQRSRQRLDGTISGTGWDTERTTEVEHWHKGRWRLARRTVLREWVRERTSSSGGYFSGKATEVTDAEGTVIHSEESEGYTIATSTVGISDKDKCDAVAGAIGSLPDLLGAGAEAVCSIADGMFPDTGTVGIPGVLSISSTDANLCEQNAKLGEATGTTLTEVVRLACYANPSYFFPTGTGGGTISVAELAEDMEFADPEGEIEAEPLDGGECKSTSEVVSMTVNGQTCEITVTTECAPTDTGGCNCSAPEASDPVCR